MATEAPLRKPNRLIHEKNPYLLQHAYNPVDWYPWGADAFEKAKREDKPIFLSVGYSTCYWCHVMEQESFENPALAKQLNAAFVPIKVDREERPDIDAVYMSAVQAMTGQGGWPMTVFLTPSREPFWGGTYFPPEDRWGKPGLGTVLQSIAEAWKTRREDLLKSGQSVAHAIASSSFAKADAAVTLSPAVFDAAVKELADSYDSTFGGFGSAPKFPRSHVLSFLLRAYTRNHRPELLKMVQETLEAMARGGMHDQLGGGFHRYSTDAQWLVPHFEKMLYDQALLARTYLEAYQLTGKPLYADVARDIFEYVLRDMRDPQGGFYSAEDAGEVGKEGEFYVWTSEEIDQALGADDAGLVKQYFGVTPAGNFSASAEGARGGSLPAPQSEAARQAGAPSVGRAGGEHGTTILSIPQSPEAFAKAHDLDEAAWRKRLDEAKAKLLAARNQRTRPHRDDKVLADWNGLMIGSFAYGARVLHEPRYAQAAAQAARFLLERLQRDGRPFDSAQGRGERAKRVEPRLLHRFRDGEAQVRGFLDDYAFVGWGLSDLYELTFEPRWLEQAIRLSKEMIRLFWDEHGGGFLFSAADNEQLIARTKDLYDGAVPSGNSVAALNLVRLSLMTMDKDLHAHAERLFAAFSAVSSQAPQAFPQFLIALDVWLGPSQEIVIAGEAQAPETRAMIDEVDRRFLPRAVVALHPSGQHRQAIEQLMPFIKDQDAIQGRPTAYVCRNYVCQLPVTDVQKFAQLLDSLQ